MLWQPRAALLCQILLAMLFQGKFIDDRSSDIADTVREMVMHLSIVQLLVH
jgi:hypothetical protein